MEYIVRMTEPVKGPCLSSTRRASFTGALLPKMHPYYARHTRSANLVCGAGRELKQAAPPGHGSPRPSAAGTGTNRGVLGSKRFQCRKNSFRAWIYANWRNKAPVNDALRVDDEQGRFTGSVILTIYSIKTRDCSFHR